MRRELLKRFKKPLMNRPRFMQEKALSPAEINGYAYGYAAYRA